MGEAGKVLRIDREYLRRQPFCMKQSVGECWPPRVLRVALHGQRSESARRPTRAGEKPRRAGAARADPVGFEAPRVRKRSSRPMRPSRGDRDYLGLCPQVTGRCGGARAFSRRLCSPPSPAESRDTAALRARRPGGVRSWSGFRALVS